MIRGLAIATALVLAAAAGAWLIRARARPAPARPTSLATTDALMDGAVRVVVSPAGQRLCVYSDAEMAVIDLASGARWTRVGLTYADSVQFLDEARVAFGRSVELGTATEHVEQAVWTFATGQIEASTSPNAERWLPLATTSVGPLVRDGRPPFTLAIGAGATPRPLGLVARDLLFALSPDRRRLVATQAGAGTQTQLVVLDLASGATLATSAPIRDLTALGWRHDDEVAFAAGLPGASQVFAWTFATAPTWTPRPLLTHAVPDEWIGGVAVVGDAVIAITTRTVTATHLLDLRDATGVVGDVVLDARAVAALVSWRAASTAVVWNRGAARIEDVDLTGAPTAGGATVPLADELHTGTRAGELLLLTTRSADGRVVGGYAPGAAAPRWQHPAGDVLLARCAGDVAPPCVAVVHVDGESVVQAITPATGALVGDALARASGIADVAVRTDGGQLAWVDLDGGLWVRDLVPAGPARRMSAGFSLARTLAYAPDGALLIGRQEQQRTLVRVAADGHTTTLWRTDAPILALARPAPDGRRIAVRTRSYANALLRPR